MSSNNIDERVVAMKFQNSQFQSGVSETLTSLDKLKAGLNLDGATKGLASLAAAGKNISLAGIADGVENISSKFTALGVIAITALSNIANKAINMGTSLVKSLTIDPVKAGFDEYELKMGSIQTILANTQKYGTTLPQVTAALDDLNSYADKTIYNFGDMTKNIGLFTNAGIRIEDATSMIKGFSNAAAASGTNAQQAAGAAYQLSQALSAGKVTLMDWKSLQNAGMGNKNMQQGILDIASAMGTLESHETSADEVQQNFNGSLEKGWLTADVMSKYLNIMAGDMDAASMSALGLSDAQIASFQAQQKTAEEAATKVRTFTQLLGTMREAVGSAWSETFGLLLGDFDQATELFTNVNDTLGPMIAAAGKARNDLITGWIHLGGRDMVIESISNAFKALLAIIKPVTDAFREIFPPVTLGTIMKITEAIRDFTASMMPSTETINNIKSTAKGLFAVLDIGRMIIMGVVGVIIDLLGNTKGLGGGILEVTGNIGDWLVSVRDAIKNGDGLAKVFKFIGDMLQKPIDLLKDFGKAAADAGSNNSERLADLWERIGTAVKTVYQFLKPAIDWLVNGLKEIGSGIHDAFQEADPNILLGLLNVGLLGGVGLLVKKLIKIVKEGISVDLTGGLVEQIKGVFGALTDTMKTMQTKIKAEALQKIAIAIGILAAAVLVLSFIDPVRLVNALGAMTIMFAQMAGMLYVLDKAVSSTGGAAKLGILAAALILLASAMVIFSAAVLIMSSMDWNELARGLAGMAVGLGILIGATKLLGAGTTLKLVTIAGALAILSSGMVLLASALKIMGSMSWEEVGTSMVVLAGSLGILVGAMRLMQSGILGATSMVIVASAVTILAGALKILASMRAAEVVKSLVALAGGLAILVIATNAMEGSLVGAAAVLIVSVALNALAAALKIMGSMSWDEIGRAIVVLAGSLAILAAAMALMGIPLVLLGAVGLLAAAASLMAIAPALVLLGTMSWDAIGRGLTVLGAALAIMAVAGVLLIPAIPGLLALGAAVALIGIGALAAGIGISMFALGLVALSAAGAVALQMIGPAIAAFAAQIPLIAASIAEGILTFATVIGEGGPTLILALTNILLSLIAAIVAVIPALVNAGVVLIMALVNAIVALIPFLVDAGLRLIIGLLDGVANNIGKVIEKGTDVIVQFMAGIGKAIPRLLQAGAQLILDFVNGLADTIRRNTAAMNAAGTNLANAIIDGMTSGIRNGVTNVINAAKNMAQSALNAAKNLLGIHSPSREFAKVGEFSAEGMANGMDDNTDLVVRSAEDMGTAAVNAVKTSLQMLADAVNTNIDAQPVIAPVLDLTAIKRDAATISKLIPTPSLSLESVSANAKLAAAGYEENQRVYTDADGTPTTGDSYTFNQTNNSPKTLSDAEIYRNTKNLLSVKKGELDK